MRKRIRYKIWSNKTYELKNTKVIFEEVDNII